MLRKFNLASVVFSTAGRKPLEASIFYTRKLSYFVQILDFVPAIYDSLGNLREPSELKVVKFDSQLVRDGVLAFLNSSLFYWLVTLFSDCRNLNKREIQMARLNTEDENGLKQLAFFARDLMADIKANSQMKTLKYRNLGTLKIQSTYPRLSKPIIDEIDKVLAKHYGFTERGVGLHYQLRL